MTDINSSQLLPLSPATSLDRVAEVISLAFQSDNSAVTRMFFPDSDNASLTFEKMVDHFKEVVSQLFKIPGTVFLQVQDYSGVAIWYGAYFFAWPTQYSS